jgi:choline dehydrogenase-like flavoprotein
MQSDGRTVPQDSTLTADLCVVGSGAAGIALALELASTRLSLIIVESGGFEPDPATQSLAEGEVIGLPTFPLNVSRLRMFGGTTGHWGGFCRPFDPLDFEERPWVPHSGWPIGISDVRPHYDRAQELCQVGPPDYDPAQWDLKDTPPLPLGGGKVGTTLIQFSPPTRFGVRYRDTIVKAPNIHLVLNSNVIRIELSANGLEVNRVAAATLSGNKFFVKARAYVLAAGGIENPRILLASNQIVPQGVGNDNDLVGRYFADHINLDTAAIFALSDKYSFALYQREQRQTTRTPLRAKGSNVSVMGLLCLTEAAQRSERALNYSAELPTTYFSDLFLHQERYSHPSQSDSGGESQIARMRETLTTLYENLDDAISAALHGASVRHGYYQLMTVQEQAPNPASRVLLSERRDKLGVPMARLDWRLTDLDRHTLRVATRLIAQSMGAAGVARLRVSMDLESSAWPLYMESSWHHCGTTRMHSNPRQGVVNENCRVHGMANLYVAGSSVFTTNSSANPTLTIVALALRLGQHLKETLV